MDNKKNQRVIATLQLEDQGQDFTEIDVLENGVILGNSPIFSHGRLSLLGVGTSDGIDYEHNDDFITRHKGGGELRDYGNTAVYLYFYETGEKQPVPWEAQTLKYRVVGEVKVKQPERFLVK